MVAVDGDGVNYHGLLFSVCITTQEVDVLSVIYQQEFQGVAIALGFGLSLLIHRS